MNEKIAAFFCDPKKAAKNIALLLLMIFIVVYTIFQILPSFSEKLETETALIVTVSETNETNGYIFRDEIPVYGYTDNGVVVTLVKDGDRVSKGQNVANIYPVSDYTSLQEQIDDIKAQIAVLEKSSVETNMYVTDIGKTDKEIDDSLDVIYKAVSSGNLDGVSSAQSNLLISMNKRDIITDVSSSYSKRLKELEKEHAELESRINVVSDSVIAESSGYYYGDTDGYEDRFTLDALNNLTSESFEALKSLKPNEVLLNSEYGKIVKSFEWFAVCESDKLEAGKYAVGKYYDLEFSSFTDSAVSMKLQKKINAGDKILLQFRGNTAPEGFDYERNQKVNIIDNNHTGYAVPKKALRIVEGTQGVYVISGDVVRFRRVEILSDVAVNSDYYIVKIPDTAVTSADSDKEEMTEEKYKYLSLYDNVIVDGKDLFDGKIVG